MKELLLFISVCVFGMNAEALFHFEKQNPEKENNFKLSFVTVGLGSNMYKMQPVFKVEDKRFSYTLEKGWSSAHQHKIKTDTLLTGDFRKSSADSISNLLADLKDSIVSRSNPYVLSGLAAYIEVSTAAQKITFSLHNQSDNTADKIVAILNSYIPEGFKKLHVSDIK